jgi:hypothetical protein
MLTVGTWNLSCFLYSSKLAAVLDSTTGTLAVALKLLALT